LILLAGEDIPPAENGALARLCEAYWSPLYVFARKRGLTAEDAADSTQAYFTKLIEKRYVRDARADRGRFRSFLLASFSHFLANEFDRRKTRKRGGDRVLVPIHLQTEAQLCSVDLSSEVAPDRLFEKQWAATLISRALARVERDMSASGKAAAFEVMKTQLTGGDCEESYERQAARLGMSAGAFKTEVYRLRKRFRAAVRFEIAATVESPDQVDDELRFLFGALAD
jgi:RNA polymerase sigma-70 factor (ECF subfamily)